MTLRNQKGGAKKKRIVLNDDNLKSWVSTSIHREGSLCRIFYFVFTFGAAVAGFLVGKVLALTGYVANQAQTEAALPGIRSLLTLFPFFFIVAGIVILSFFPIDAAMHRHMIEQIQAKKGGLSVADKRRGTPTA